MTKSIVGTSIVSLPRSTALLGLLGCPLLIFVAFFVNVHSLYLILKNARKSKSDSYSQLCNVAFGRPGLLLATFLLLLGTFVPLVYYTHLSASYVQQFLMFCGLNPGLEYVRSLCTIVLGILCVYFREIGGLRRISACGLVCVFIFVAYTAATAFLGGPESGLSTTLDATGQSTGTIVPGDRNQGTIAPSDGDHVNEPNPNVTRSGEILTSNRQEIDDTPISTHGKSSDVRASNGKLPLFCFKDGAFDAVSRIAFAFCSHFTVLSIASSVASPLKVVLLSNLIAALLYATTAVAGAIGSPNVNFDYFEKTEKGIFPNILKITLAIVNMTTFPLIMTACRGAFIELFWKQKKVSNLKQNMTSIGITISAYLVSMSITAKKSILDPLFMIAGCIIMFGMPAAINFRLGRKTPKDISSLGFHGGLAFLGVFFGLKGIYQVFASDLAGAAE